jgi:hypothetical protein
MIKKEETVNILLLIASVFILIVLRCQARLGDSDFFWHITLGGDILMNGKIPVEDTYSWLSAEFGLVETAHSWLSSVCLFLSTLPFGGEDIFGAVLYTVLTYILFQVVVYCLFIRRIEGDAAKSAATVASIILGFMLYDNARPQNIGYVIFVVAVYLLIKLYEDGQVKHLLLMPLVCVCWANFHGGTIPMLFAFNAMFLVLTFLPDFELGKVYSKCADKKKARKYLTGALGLNLVSGLLNPYNIRLYVYFFVTNNAVTKKYVTEWQSASIISLPTIFALLCFFYLFVIAKNKYPLHKVLPLVITFLLSGIHVRIGCYSYIFEIVLMCDELAQVKCERGKALKLIPTAIITAVAAVFSVYSLSGTAGELEIKNSNVLNGSVKEFLADKQFKRMYNMYDTGGFLIYEGFQSFIDSRADLFTDEILKDGFHIERLSCEDAAQIEALFDKYQFDSLLIMKCDGVKSLMCFMSLMDDWDIGYEDDDWIVYVPLERVEV